MSVTVEELADKLDAGERNALRLQSAALTPEICGALQALQFRGRSCDGLGLLSPSQWTSLVEWCGHRQIALVFESVCRDVLPNDVRQKLAQRHAAFERRIDRIQRQTADIADVLDRAGIPFAVLKGFTHSPSLCPDPVLRAQGDIDLWCQPSTVARAHAALQTAGYRPGPAKSGRHLAPLSLPHNWVWDGDLASVPISVELHHTLWSEQTEHIPVLRLDEMWERRVSRTFYGRKYDVLATEDLVAFAALHFFLHLVGGDLPLQRLWEIANFLHAGARDPDYWRAHLSLHSKELVEIETIVFQVAAAWLNCELSQPIVAAAEQLPEHVKLWFDTFPLAPLEAQIDSNKNHIWLRLAMTRGWPARSRVFVSTLVPLTLPVFQDRAGGAQRVSVIGSLVRQRTYLLSRIERHVASISPTIRGGIRWIAGLLGLEQGFGAFLAASALFDVGEFLFVILYNFYLLDIGLREDTVGLVAAALTVGSLVGSPIAAALQPKFKLRGLLLIASVGGGAATLMRSGAVAVPILTATAALNGVFFSFWAVSFAPVVAGLSRARNRSIIFGFVTAMGMSIGILIGIVGVRLPGWISSALSVSQITGTRAAMLLGSTLVLLASIPAWRVKVPDCPYTERSYPRGRFIALFIAALFLWILATTSFNAFGIPYLSLRMHLQPVRVGELLSTGQTLQVLAMLCGPLLIRRMGEKQYVFGTALATATMLLLLATGAKPLCLVAYLAYVTFQYMNEPSLFALLMNRVSPSERSGASSLMFITMSIAGTIAAAVAGRVISRLGYPVCLTIAALVAASAALLFFTIPDFASRLHKSNNKPSE